jgi:hypothetical protein
VLYANIRSNTCGTCLLLESIERPARVAADPLGEWNWRRGVVASRDLPQSQAAPDAVHRDAQRTDAEGDTHAACLSRRASGRSARGTWLAPRAHGGASCARKQQQHAERADRSGSLNHLRRTAPAPAYITAFRLAHECDASSPFRFVLACLHIVFFHIYCAYINALLFSYNCCAMSTV